MKSESMVVLLVEDEPAHAEIVRRNFADFHPTNRLIHVADGQAALDYLFRRGQYRDPELSPRPALVLLDLRLPKVDGLEVLKAIKTDPKSCRIPVVILSTSAAETDIVKAYDSHANSYLVKPVDFPRFVALMEALGRYWLTWNENPA